MTKAHTYSEEVADMDIHSVLATLPYSIKAYVVANPDMICMSMHISSMVTTTENAPWIWSRSEHTNNVIYFGPVLSVLELI